MHLSISKMTIENDVTIALRATVFQNLPSGFTGDSLAGDYRGFSVTDLKVFSEFSANDL